ncbi:MAG: hypothetical protein C0518_09065 [Opitutus sp.]|nr:hypothetical protein [Opitutus sp.]
MIFYCVLTSGLNALTSFVLAVMLFLKRPRGPANAAFCWFALTGALWSVFYFLWQTAPDAEHAFFFSRWLSAAAILIPIAYFQFVLRLLGQVNRLAVRGGYVLAFTAAVLSLGTDTIVRGVEAKHVFPFWPVPGPFYAVYLLVFFSYLSVALWKLVAGYRRAQGLVRNQLRFVILGTAIGFLGGATNFFLWYDIPIPPVGNGLVAFYVVGVGYAVLRFRLMEFNLLTARLSVYTALTVLFAALPPVIMQLLAWLQVPTVPNVGFWPMFLTSTAVTIAMFAAIPEMRRRIDALLEQRVLGERLADRDLLRALAAKISSSQDENAMFHEVAVTVAAALRVSDVALYTRTEFETDFTRRAIAREGAEFGPAMFPEVSLLMNTLQSERRGLLVDELVHSLAGDQRTYFNELRRRHGFELLVPIIGDSFFYGCLVAGSRAGNSLFTDIDVSLLDAIGLQIGLNLRARQLERRASQTEKLIALGTLAAGLAHELRNPLTSVQTFSALLKESRPDADALQEFSAVVQRDVNRIASIVENVAAFAESNKVDMTAVNVGDVLRAATEIVHPEIERLHVKVELPRVNAPVHGNHSQLLQVFLNLVQNALQALEGRPDPRLVFTIERRPNGPGMVCIAVRDNGAGIDPALLPRVFEPFITTKSTGERRGKHGMGLGLAIVKRIVQHHHGEIHVASTLGQGTTFRVYLPAV